jgi:hypothetical protein
VSKVTLKVVEECVDLALDLIATSDRARRKLAKLYEPPAEDSHRPKPHLMLMTAHSEAYLWMHNERRGAINNRKIGATLKTAAKLRSQLNQLKLELAQAYDDDLRDDARWIEAHFTKATAPVECWLREVQAHAQNAERYKVRHRPQGQLYEWFLNLSLVWQVAGLSTGTHGGDLFARFVITLHRLLLPKAAPLTAHMIRRALRPPPP